MAGKPGGTLLVEYYQLNKAEYPTAFEASDWLGFFRAWDKLMYSFNYKILCIKAKFKNTVH